MSVSSPRLIDLVSVGPATVADLEVLGITTVEQLRGQQAQVLLGLLQRRTGHAHDPCCEDVFACAIAQAENPDLPAEQKQWWWWSRQRKARSDDAGGKGA